MKTFQRIDPSSFLMLLPAAALLGAGILLFWLIPPDGRLNDLYRDCWIPRQSIYGVLALGLAWGMGRYRLHRPFLNASTLDVTWEDNFNCSFHSEKDKAKREIRYRIYKTDSE